MPDNCDTCYHFREVNLAPSGEPIGNCHRHAPRPRWSMEVGDVTGEDAFDAVWPVVWGWQGCGEWEKVDDAHNLKMQNAFSEVRRYISIEMLRGIRHRPGSEDA